MSVVYKCDWCDEKISSKVEMYSQIVHLPGLHKRWNVIACLTINSVGNEDICKKCFQTLKTDALNQLRDKD